jgi:16S rRNA (guanine966-N2)-methyltransferase
MSGTVRGLNLRVPKTGVRPTMELVKGAIFSSLHDVIPGARVLDLFAGSGSLGLEALSRGAAHVVFVENDRGAIKVIRENLAKARFAAEVQPLDIFSYLDRLAPPGGFDLIIADPPYAKAPGERDFGSELLMCESLRRALAPDGIFVLEHLPHAKLNVPPAYECFRDKAYGATAVAFLRHAEPAS